METLVKTKRKFTKKYWTFQTMYNCNTTLLHYYYNFVKISQISQNKRMQTFIFQVRYFHFLCIDNETALRTKKTLNL